MKFINALLLSLICLVLIASAQPTQSENEAIFFKITGNGLEKPSYLFGTIHIMCDNEEFSAAQLAGAMASTDRVLMEIDLDKPISELFKASSKQKSEYKKLRPLSEVLSKSEYALVEKKLKSYLPIPLRFLDKLPPELLIPLVIASPKALGCPASIASYDRKIAATAKSNKIEIDGLETVQQQLKIFDDEKQVDSKKVFLEFINKLEDQKTNMVKLRQIYFRQNSDELFEYTTKSMKDDPKFGKKLLDDRNKIWAPKIEKRLGKESYFIAVGAAHLGGENGLLNLLRLRGYNLKPIKLKKVKSIKPRPNPADQPSRIKKPESPAVSTPF